MFPLSVPQPTKLGKVLQIYKKYSNTHIVCRCFFRHRPIPQSILRLISVIPAHILTICPEHRLSHCHADLLPIAAQPLSPPRPLP